MKLVDKYGLERTTGQFAVDDKVVVTSPNGQVHITYHISVLREQYLPEANYLAYILSLKYNVDQVTYSVTGPVKGTSVSDFHSNIRTAPGATAMVMDENGNQKAEGSLAQGDYVKVVSADGKVTVAYAIDFDITSVQITDGLAIDVYPNPTNGLVYVKGAKNGSQILVYNVIGSVVHQLEVDNNIETLNIRNQPAGIYLVVVKKNTDVLVRHKVIKQ